MPQISVIVPVYQVEPYLRCCVDSVLAQTFADFELILVDDGSPDGCGAICDEYAARDSRVLVTHTENGGLGKARNTGMDLACGKYLIFLDSDDYLLPATLETLYTEAERNRTQVLIFGAVPFLDGLEQPDWFRTYTHTVQNGIVKTGPDSLKTALDAGEYYPQPCLRLYLHTYWRSNGLRFDEGVIHEDEKCSFLACLFAERAECIGDRLYLRRYRPGSIMSNKTVRDSARGHRTAMDGLMDVYENRPLAPLGRELLARYIRQLSGYVIEMYRQELRQDRKTARWIRKDARQTLKRMRALPGLSRSTRLAAYSLFLSCFVTGVCGKLRRLMSSAGKSP